MFLAACRREPTPYTPIWLLRQAGRYLEEYRRIRRKVSLLELCKSPDLAAEITLTAAERLRADAAIIFSDLLLVLEPMGRRLEYLEDQGPRVSPPLRSAADLAGLRRPELPGDLPWLFEALRRTRASLPRGRALIGFAGAPFTLAAYLIEGQTSRSYEHTKAFCYADRGAWYALLEQLREVILQLLLGQIAAGAQAVQLFDSWVGCLRPSDYRTLVLPHVRWIFQRLPPDVPAIHFATGNPGLLEGMREAGGSVLGLDYRVDLDEAWARLGDVAVQGNLDPCALLADPATVRREAQRILDQAAGRPGHIFNLGHGVLPSTPVEHVQALVDYVHERTS